ncbi:BRCT domain-containing protein At4g02110 [Linum grandiflorum]
MKLALLMIKFNKYINIDEIKHYSCFLSACFTSGYELEMMETEAKDSEDDVPETSLMVSTGHIANQSLRVMENGSPKICNLSKPIPTSSALLAEDMYFHNADEVVRTPVNKKRVDMGCSPDKNHASDLIAAPSERTPGSGNGGGKENSVSRSVAKPSLSYTDFIAISHSRKTPLKSPSSLFIGASKALGCSPKVQIAESTNFSSTKVEVADQQCGSSFEDFERLIAEQLSDGKKQRTDALESSSKSHQMCQDRQTCITGSPSVSYRAQGLKSSSLDTAPGLNDSSPDGGYPQSHSGKGIFSPNVTSNTHSMSALREKSLAEGVPFGENATLGKIGNQSTDMKHQALVSGLKEWSSASKQDNEVLCIDKSEVADLSNPQVRASPAGKIDIVTVKTPVVTANQKQDNSLQTKQPWKQTATKKTLGSRTKLKNTVKEKGSIYLKESTAHEDLATDPRRRNDRIDDGDNLLMAREFENPPPSVVSVEDTEKKLVIDLGTGVQDNTDSMNDETEPPDNKEQLSDAGLKEMMETGDLVGSRVQKEPEEVRPVGGNSNVWKVDDVMEDPQKKDKSTSEGDDDKKKQRKCKRLTSIKRRRTIVSTVDGESNSSKDVEPEEADGESNSSKAVEPEEADGESNSSKAVEPGEADGDQAAENKSDPNAGSCPSSKNLSRRRSRISMEADKENKTITQVHRSGSMAEKHAASCETTMDDDQEVVEEKPPSGKHGDISSHVVREPTWFIVSGHRLQRKEFQQVIRRLKGKSCGDSHQWSYQATHFIAPDPIRRTEKFFAAAASGRWILKTDYLGACSQAGKFLPEEPYEWYKNGLSEDGAINFEAPRKWRLLRERTGHGAFHGMKIVIYGECISPPLEILKRAVKAGDGTILATSPPYSRFLGSGIDYAIVSPRMPSVDVWVQEFLRREIPCIVGDYLVDYVCKSGYSLEKHVLFGTQKWAEKSFSNLMSKAEEIVVEVEESAGAGEDEDVGCQVCGSRDRGEVMLLCGDESGKVGCGGGRHIDCCDPPLECIPEEDWFCPNCQDSFKKKKRKKGTRCPNYRGR